MNELVAQLVEQRTFNAWVSGSIPDELTTPQAATLLKFNSKNLDLDCFERFAWTETARGIPGSKNSRSFHMLRERLAEG